LLSSWSVEFDHISIRVADAQTHVIDPSDLFHDDSLTLTAVACHRITRISAYDHRHPQFAGVRLSEQNSTYKAFLM